MASVTSTAATREQIPGTPPEGDARRRAPRRRSGDRGWLLTMPLALWVLLFFLVPIGLVVYSSFKTYATTELGSFTVLPTLTLEGWKDAVLTSDFVAVLWGSAKLGLAVTAITVLLCVPYTYALSFHVASVKVRSILLVATLLPFFVSYVMQVYAWQPMLAESGILHQLSGGIVPVLLRSSVGAYVGLVGYVFPVATLLIYLSMNTIDKRFLEAAVNLGARRSAVFRDVVLRLSLPGIVMGGMLAFVLSFSDLLSARALGSVRTVAGLVRDYQFQAGNTPAAAAVSVVMLIAILLVVLASLPLVRQVAVSGSGVVRAGVAIERGVIGRWWWRFYIAAGLLFVSIPPLILTVYGFFGPQIPVWPIPYLSTRWYTQFFNDPLMLEALMNSLKVSAVVAVVATTLGGLSAYYMSRHQPRWSVGYTVLVLLPAIVPPIVLSLGLMVYFIELGIWGSIWTLAIAHVGMVSVFSMFIIQNRLQQIDPKLEEAARNLGASRLRAVRDIVLPLALPAIVASIIVAGGLSFGESIVTTFLTAQSYTWPAYSLQIVVQATTPLIYAGAGFVYGVALLVLGTILGVTALHSVRAARKAKIAAAAATRRPEEFT